jgi:5-formyltetrahydrofolate cyclo-ligase
MSDELAEMKLAKQLLRKEIVAKVKSLSASEKVRQSQAVTQKLLGSSMWQKSERISVFLSLPDEVSTDVIVDEALRQNKQLFIPRYTGDKMDMLRLYSAADLQTLPPAGRTSTR